MRTRTKVLAALFLSAVMAVLPGCRTQEKAAKVKPKLPETYAGTGDTANIADRGWQAFYADTSLRRLIDTALKNNQDMLKTLQHIALARAELKLNNSNLLPVVSGAVSVGQRRFGKYTMDGVGNYDTRFSPNITPEQIIPEHLPDYFVGVQASWEADIWGKLRNRRKAAFLRYLAGLEGRNLVMTGLVYEIAVMYYDLLAYDNQLDIISESILLQENALSIIRFQKEAGIANELAVQQFEAQLFRLKSLDFETRQQITATEAGLNFLCGRFPQPISRNKSGFFDSSGVSVNAGVPSQLLRNRPDIRKAENELRASRADVRAARAAFYPSLGISAGVGFQAFNPAFLFSPASLAYNVLGNLAAPLINRNAVRAAFRSANARQKEALLSYQQSILRGFTEVYTELALIRNLESVMDLKSSEARVLSSSIETSSELFRSGRASYLEVLAAQQNALRAKLELVDTQKRQYHARVQVYRALGGGWK